MKELKAVGVNIVKGKNLYSAMVKRGDGKYIAKYSGKVYAAGIRQGNREKIRSFFGEKALEEATDFLINFIS